jgi:ribonucleotide reductase alpha subunit
MNLNHYCVKMGGEPTVLTSRLYEDVGKALCMLDMVRARLIYPFPFMRQASEDEGRLGLGVMGFADVCKKLNIPYGS